MAGLRQYASGAGTIAQAEPRPPEVRQGKDTRHEADRRRDELAKTIEGEIIPRLMLAHRLAPADGLEFGDVALDGGISSIADFARIAMSGDTATAARHIEGLARMGVRLDAIFLELLAPTARHLGRMWEEDLCDFTDVTVGLGCLQNLLRQFSPAFQNESETPATQLRTLLVPTPGEQHTFGIFMVEEFFRREGWHVVSDPALSEASLTRLVRNEWFDLVGFSLSCEDLLDRLASVIRSIRRASRNREVRILVGGAVFFERPDLVQAAGADGTAADGPQAVQLITARATSSLLKC
jgi:methanogenic corrinoid protein MtbC1